MYNKIIGEMLVIQVINIGHIINWTEQKKSSIASQPAVAIE